ncbi:hypothetical protein Q5752_005027 [Cryptotrichosporon argae]
MPPPLPGSRITATPAQKQEKVRYFKGKPIGGPAPDSDSDSDDAAPEPPLKGRAPAAPKQDPRLVAGGAGRVIGDAKGIKLQLRDVKVEGGRVVLGGVHGGVKHDVDEESSEEEESEEEEKPAPRSIPKPPGSAESSEYETDLEEDEEEPKKPAFRPLFVSKTARKTVGLEEAARAAEEAARIEEEQREQRKLDSKELAGETIRRELIEKEVSDSLVPDVDDTDGLDAAAEFEDWRARELGRLLREKQAQAAADAEREEIERRRAMPEDVRLAEDMEYADQTRAREKGQMGFLQRYHHKGAFHLDDDLANRDYSAATESAVDMSMLPKVMQVRNFGKASRTKYTHLTDQDTSGTGWGSAAARPGQIGTTQTGCWNCGGPHLRQDCPNNGINADLNVVGGVNIGGAGGSGTSANASGLGYGAGSKWGTGRGGDGERGGRDERGGYGDRDRGNDDRDRYHSEGRERRFEDERHRDRAAERYERDERRGSGRDDRERDRDGHRERERKRSRSPRRDHRRRERSRERR